MNSARIKAASLLLVMLLAIGSARAQSTDDEDAILGIAKQSWSGDFDALLERGFIRILTTYNPLFFYPDGPEQHGLAVENARAFEGWINKQHRRKKTRPLSVVLISVPRDRLLSDLVEGRGDIVAANLTITPIRQESVDFSMPTYPGVNELVVTGPGAPAVKSFDDLVSSGIHIRRSSSYFEHLSSLNEARRSSTGSRSTRISQSTPEDPSPGRYARAARS
jgi:membrane-bound lytic murein transglycosylase MltF